MHKSPDGFYQLDNKKEGFTFFDSIIYISYYSDKQKIILTIMVVNINDFVQIYLQASLKLVWNQLLNQDSLPSPIQKYISSATILA